MQISLQIKKTVSTLIWFWHVICVHTNRMTSSLKNTKGVSAFRVVPLEKEVYIKFIMMLSRYQLPWIYVLLFPESLIKMKYQMQMTKLSDTSFWG